MKLEIVKFTEKRPITYKDNDLIPGDTSFLLTLQHPNGASTQVSIPKQFYDMCLETYQTEEHEKIADSA